MKFYNQHPFSYFLNFLEKVYSLALVSLMSALHHIHSEQCKQKYRVVPSPKQKASNKETSFVYKYNKSD